MFELLVAAKLLLTAPTAILGTDRARIEARLGRPLGVGTDLMRNRHGEGTTDRVITLDWPDIRVRLYEVPSAKTVSMAWQPKRKGGAKHCSSKRKRCSPPIRWRRSLIWPQPFHSPRRTLTPTI